MKKISGLFVFLALSVSLFACSAQEQPGKELPEPVRPSVPDKDDEDQYLKDEGALRLVTYNVGSFSKSDKTSCGLVSAMMLELKADVISFNELDRNTDRSGRVDQLAEVAAGMDGWKYVFAKAISLGGGEYGNGIAYNPVTVGEPVSQFTIAFPEAAEPRVCLVLEFEDFVFASTHLDVASPTERVAEVTEITRQMMDRFAGKGKPVFLAGDMNEQPADPAISKLKENWSMSSTNAPTYPSDSPKTCIDIIFLMDNSGKCTVAGAGVGNRFTSGNVAVASDHLPVYVDIMLSE